MDHCDVLIVGGGPAGSACATRLRAAGRDVVVLDKAQFPRHKVCAGWITPQIVHSLRLDLAHYAVGRVLQPFSRFLTGLIDGPVVETPYPHPASFGIRRCEFDDYLLRRAQARLVLGEGLHSVHAERDRWIVNDAYSARVLVGAGGHFCPVARALAVRHPLDEPVVLAQEVEFPLPAPARDNFPVHADRPELYFCPDFAGYGWIVRKGDYLNIGLGREREQNLATHTAAFVEFLRHAGRLPIDLPDRFHGHAYRLRRYAPPITVPPGVLLIGDALGLAAPQSGEGIRPAVESGILAAEILLARPDQARDGLLDELRNRLQQRCGSGTSPRSVDQLLPSSLRRALARLLLRSRWFHRHVLLNRWFLHAHQPAL